MEPEGFDDGTFNLAIAQCQGALSLPVFSTWLAIGLNASFIVLSAPNIIALLRGPTIVHAPAVLLISKLVLGTAFTAFNIALLILSRVQPGRQTNCSLSLGGLNLAAACFSVALSLCAHFKSRRPSTLLCSYLFIALLNSVARCQQLWISVQNGGDRIFSAFFTATTTVMLAFLGLNAQRLSQETTDHSPEETSGILSLGLYAWLNELLMRGYRRIISLDDLYPLDQAISAGLLDQAARRFPSPEQYYSNLDILRWAARPLIKPLLLPVLPRLCLVGFTLCQPFFIQRLLGFLDEGGARTSQTTASSLIGAVILIYAGTAVSTSLYWYYQERAQSMLRAYLVSSIYHKTAEVQAASGMAAVTLMSTDVDRIYTGMRNMHEIWASLIQIVLSCWLLQRLLGLVFIAPLVVVLLGFASSFALSKYAVRFQRNWMKHVQERIEITSHVLSYIKEMRISGMTAPVMSLVQGRRIEEIHHGAKSRSLTAISATLSQIPHAVAPVITFAFGPHVLGNTAAFTSLSYLTLLTSPLMTVLQIVPIVAACMACLRRIHEFLSEKPKLDPREIIWKHASPDTDAYGDAAITIRAGQFGWDASTHVLNDINLTVVSHSVTFIIGPTASGKTTLLKSILGEVPFVRGDVVLNVDPGKIAFCDQAPFLINATIMENIVGFSSFDTTRYREVIHATMLQHDFSSLPAADRTKVGSKGATLSGGQRQRVALARALYHEAELLVLDDVFTGLDTNTQESMSKRLFGDQGLLRRRRTTVVLCTQATKILPLADHVLALTSEGLIDKSGSPEDFQRDGRYSHLFRVSEPTNSASNSETLDDMTAQTEKIETDEGVTKRSGNTCDHSEKTKKPAMQADISVYRHYLSTIGLAPLVVYLFLVIGIGFCDNFPTVWLKFWSADSIKSIPSRSFASYMGIYGLLNGLTLLCVFGGGIIVLRTFVRLSGTHLHEQTLKAALHASLRFLSVTDTGTVLNLFSQDMTIIDSQLPRMINNMCITAAIALGQAAVIAVSSGYLAICYPFIMAILYSVQKFYLPTSKQLRILDLEAKSPLYTHFLDTLNGLVTIRAFGWFPQQVARNKDLLDTSQRPSYLLAMVQQWLLLTMNMVVAVLGTILVSLATYLRSTDAGSVGAGLVMLITFGSTLASVISAYTGLEISLGGIARLKTFAETTEREDKDGEILEPPEEWPGQGRIAINNLTASYSDDQRDPTLAGLSLTVQPGEKVAFCGSTGSGKSSVLALLLRILEPILAHGPNMSEIRIDDIQLSSVSRSILRMRLIAASQDAIFLPDGRTFRENLDPWRAATADEADDVLETVGLQSLVIERGGIDAEVRAAELSAGQRQLFALGRAVLRRRVRARRMAEKGVAEGGVVLLDEATASLDGEVEERMARVIWREFKAYTVLLVTHSVDLASKCDRVVVLDRGAVVEDGDPKGLLANEEGAFRALAKAGNR